jgi:hypothetical protein
MNALDPISTNPLCHRCKAPMVSHSLEKVHGKEIRIFLCLSCHTLEAFGPPEKKRPSITFLSTAP